MAKTSGQVNFEDYPAGMRALFARTTSRSTWDAGGTTFDGGKTTFDAGALGARYTRRCVRHVVTVAPIIEPATTWDAGATTWDDAAARWDLVFIGVTPSSNYGKNLALHQAFGAQHDALNGWKRFRWNVCGAARFITGRNLYLRCCHEQNTPLGKQPISPCSRRATDPLASPFDFTP